MEQFRHEERVVHQHGRENARPLFIVKGERQALVMEKQLGAHIFFHFGSHHVAEVGVIHVGADEGKQRQEQEKAGHENAFFPIRRAVHQYVVGDAPGKKGKEEGRSG